MLFWALVLGGIYVGVYFWEVKRGYTKEQAIWWPFKFAKNCIDVVVKLIPGFKDKAKELKDGLDDIHKEEKL